MAKDKYDFIQEVLKNHTLSLSQREQILMLTSIEIKRDKKLGNILEERIKKLEEAVGLIGTEDVQEELQLLSEFHDVSALSTGGKAISEESVNVKDDNVPTNALPEYIDPGNLYKYLFNYNQNPILKSTCHDIDTDELENIKSYCETEVYDYEKHLEKILEAFKEHNKLFAPRHIKPLIRGYLTGKDYYGNTLKGWSTDNIKISWSHPNLLEWANKNKIPPNSSLNLLKENKIEGFNFDGDFSGYGFKSKIFDKRVQTFRELILHFKSLFHIRTGNSLRSILININRSKEYDKKINFELDEEIFPSNIELFTDVDTLVQAYSKLIELIIDQHDVEQLQKDSKPNVVLKFYENKKSVCLSIHHINNKYNKTINDTTERIGQAYTNLINLQINGLCNLYLRANFGLEGVAFIPLWSQLPVSAHKNEVEESSIGVEHILEFCK
jgi:hypothetical protein